jgi:hypothetical protein
MTAPQTAGPCSPSTAQAQGCEWAACPEPATTFEGNWWHCPDHLHDHRSLIAESTRVPEPPRPVAMDYADEIRTMHTQGLNDRQISHRINLSRDAIGNVRRKLGLPAILSARPRGGAHGTHAGFVQHGYHGETPCEPCRLAERGYQRDAKRRQKQRRRAS